MAYPRPSSGLSNPPQGAPRRLLKAGSLQRSSKIDNENDDTVLNITEIGPKRGLSDTPLLLVRHPPSEVPGSPLKAGSLFGLALFIACARAAAILMTNMKTVVNRSEICPKSGLSDTPFWLVGHPPRRSPGAP